MGAGTGFPVDSGFRIEDSGAAKHTKRVGPTEQAFQQDRPQGTRVDLAAASDRMTTGCCLRTCSPVRKIFWNRVRGVCSSRCLLAWL